MDITENYVMEWINTKSIMDRAKAKEMEMRKNIVDAIAAGQTEPGSIKMIIGSTELTATIKTALGVDADTLEVLWPTLTTQEQECIKYKPSIVKAVFKHLPVTAPIQKAITEKPAAPTLKYKEAPHG